MEKFEVFGITNYVQNKVVLIRKGYNLEIVYEAKFPKIYEKIHMGDIIKLWEIATANYNYEGIFIKNPVG